jgi:3-oxoadipate enol-lactonase
LYDTRRLGIHLSGHRIIFYSCIDTTARKRTSVDAHNQKSSVSDGGRIAGESSECHHVQSGSRIAPQPIRSQPAHPISNMAPALLYVVTSPGPDINEDSCHDWYDNVHLPTQLTVPGVFSAVRYQCNSDSKRWLALYDLDSPDVVASEEHLGFIADESATERELIAKFNPDIRLYQQVSSMGRAPATPPKTLLVVEMTPLPTHVKEFHHWYDTNHIPQMADVPGWTRSRRFELIKPTEQGVCRFLSVHEFDKPQALKHYSYDREGKLKWRNEVIEIVTEADRCVWALHESKTAPPGTHTIFHDGIQFNVRVEGNEQGPVIAFSNPLGADLSLWDKSVVALTPTYRIVRHDQRGHGRTSQPLCDTSFPELADDLIAILDVLKIKKLHALIGCSMGAIVALDFGLRYPTRVSTVVPCDGHPSSSPELKKIMDSRIEFIQKNGVGALAEETIDRWFTGKWKQDPKNAETVKTLKEMVSRTPARCYVANVRAMEEYDYISKAKDLKVSCLVICGAQDAPLEAMKELEEAIPNARMVVIDNCGHLPMIEQADIFNEVLQNSL